MKASLMMFEMPAYEGFYRSDLAEAAQGHSLLNAQTETTGAKEMLRADLEATAKVLDKASDPTLSFHLRQEAKRLK